MSFVLLDPNKGILLENINSTNEFIKSPDVSIGSWVSAKNQYSGKGRRGRDWLDVGDEKIFFSGKISITKKNYPYHLLPLFAGSAVLKSLLSFDKSLSDSLKFKWPNDIYYLNKKVSGVLVESEFFGDLGIFVIGIGINLTGEKMDENLKSAGFLFPQGLPKGKSKSDLLELLLQKLNLNCLLLDEQEDTKNEINWINFHSLLNKRKIHTRYSGKDTEGTVIGITQNGYLLIQQEHGSIEMIDNHEDIRTIEE